ncbi:MAG: glycosyltransferase family 9 protein [Desulfobacteria bacterium]
MIDRESKRILVIRTGAVGDFIFTLPSIRAIRKCFPEAYIEVMGYSERAILAKNRYCADRVSSIDRHGISLFWVENSELPKNLTDYFGSFGLIILYSYDEDGIFSDNLRRTGSLEVVTIKPLPPFRDQRHIVDYFLDTLESFGIHGDDPIPRVFLEEPSRDYAVRFFQDHHLESGKDGFLIAIHPGSGGSKKRWLKEPFVDVIDWVADRYNAVMLLISGPADTEAVDEILRNLRKAEPILVQGVSLVRLAAILERCHCFLGVDSGITHLSAAVGIPTVAVFGPTDPDIWGPRGDNVSIVRKELDCSPCTREELNLCQNQRCLQLIGIEEVIKEIELVLDGCKILSV